MPRRVGRPSLQDQRRHEILEAFIKLVAAKGLENVTLDDVSTGAGVKRTALRHFVGNRDQLITAAMDEICRLGLVDLETPPTFTELAATLFNTERIADPYLIAWTELLPAALRLPQARATIKISYDHLLKLISAALHQHRPTASPADIREAAYAIACMAEYNYTFQSLGYPSARSNGLRRLALELADRLD